MDISMNCEIQTLALDSETFSWLLLFIMKKRASIKYSSILGFSFSTLSTLLLTGVPLPKIKNLKINYFGVKYHIKNTYQTRNKNSGLLF